MTEAQERCECPPGECHGVGKGPANCAAVAAWRGPIDDARRALRLKVALRLMVDAPDADALAVARTVAIAALRGIE